MALIPGILPNDTCYGTPQDLLELFAQYLDVPAFALNSKVVFSNTTPAALTSDVILFDTGFVAPASAINPIMKITVSGGFTDYIKNYITNAPVVTIVGADTVLILDASDSLKTKRGLVSDISVPAAGSVTFPMLSTSATEADNVASRVAKAWVNFNGTNAFSPNPSTTAIRASFNVSSITDNGVGDYTVNFITAMPDNGYATTGTAGGGASNTNPRMIGSSNTDPTTGSVRVTVVSDGGTLEDMRFCCIAIFR